MGDIVTARQAYADAQKDALKLVERARHKLGQAIREAREQDVAQEAIAKELGITREQVRRFQREYERANGLPALGNRRA